MKQFFFNLINFFKSFTDEKVIVKRGNDNTRDKAADLVNNGVKHNSSDSFCHCQKGDGISQREYAALYAKACLYRSFAYGLAEMYDPSKKEIINAVTHIDGENV